MSRFPFFFDGIKPSPPPLGERLIAGAYGLKLEVIRFEDGDGQPEIDVQYELRGSINADSVDLFTSLLRAFQTPRNEGGAA